MKSKITGGSVQNNKGTWSMVIPYKNAEGKTMSPKWKSTGLKGEEKNRNKANKMLKTYLREFEEILAQQEAIHNGTDEYFTDFLKKWLEIIKPNIAPNTYNGYNCCIKKACNYFESKKITLSTLKPIHIQDFYSSLQNNLNSNTIIHIHANIHKALKYAQKMEMILNNPADNVERPKKKEFNGVPYDEKELIKLLNACVGDPMETCIHLTAFYGFRRSEVIGLKWDAIDFNNDTIIVKSKVIAGNFDGEYKILQSNNLKTKKSRRVLKLSLNIKALLLNEQKRQAENESIYKGTYSNQGEGYICRMPSGELLRPNYASQHFQILLKNNQLKKIRFHDLRHTCASLLIKNGITLKEIQEWLGHSTIGTTGDIYAHLCSDYSNKLSDKMSDICFPK